MISYERNHKNKRKFFKKRIGYFEVGKKTLGLKLTLYVYFGLQRWGCNMENPKIEKKRSGIVIFIF